MAVTLTPAAATKVKELIDAQKGSEEWKSSGTTEANVVLRFGVRGGGCSGLSYVLEFGPRTTEHDRVMESEGIRVAVDKKSYLYVNESVIDYVAQGLSGGFVIKNPNSNSSCGCGSSFGV